MSYFPRLRDIIYCWNVISFFAILMHGSWIPNVFIFFRWRSNKFVLIHFRKTLWILNMCKIQRTLSLHAAPWMTIVFLQLCNIKHWVIVWASIYNWSCNKASFKESIPTPVQPWTMNDKHMILIRAFFDCDVVSHDTIYANYPRITNFGSSILEVRFLTKYGAQLLCDDDGKTAFYYRFRDVQ